MSVSDAIIQIYENQNQSLGVLDFVEGSIRYVYNPTVYARDPWETYLKNFCNNKKEVLFVGINPGAWGMCQTGIPFGAISVVRGWLRIEGHVGQPDNVCPKRPVLGFNCTTEEESGTRFWQLIREFCEDPEDFFGKCFLYNYCPLAFLEENGKGILPGNLQPDELRNSLEGICDAALKKIIEILEPKIVVGIGHYPEGRANKVLVNNKNIKVLYMLHPSPNTHLSEDEWLENARSVINENNLQQYFGNGAN